jgi:hypothetical protein
VNAAAYGSALYAWLAVVLGWAMARRVMGPAFALAAALAVWFGTPLFFYMYIAPPMSHACSAFAVALFLWTWLRVREHWSVGGCAVLGALAALMAMVREQDVFIAFGPGIDFLWTMATSSSSGLKGKNWNQAFAVLSRRTLAGVLAFLAFYAPQLWAYVVLNGYLGPSRLVGRKMTWTAPHAMGVLFSPEHGLLLWTPLVALALAGLAWRTLARPPVVQTGRFIAPCLLIAVASQVYVAGSVESWTVAGAFGQRRFVGLTAILIVGIAMLSRLVAPVTVPPELPPSHEATADRRSPGGGGQPRGSLQRLALPVLLALAVWWNLGLTLQFGAGLMDRQRLDLSRNAWQTFVTIPARLPDLAYRYVFERSSFYRPQGGSEPPAKP